MTKIILTLVLFLATLLTFSQEENNTKIRTITATVNNVVSNKGEIHFSIYTKEGFYTREAIQSINAKIIDGKSTITFKMEEAGTYSILCYHDSNDNKKMDFSENGMPLEDYGSSNNTRSFGPPQFESSKFILENENLNFDIKF